MARKKKELDIDIMPHVLVPRFTLLDEKAVKQVLGEFKITRDQLPKIRMGDAMVRQIDREGGAVTEGSVIKVIRESPTAGVAIAYRLVIRG